MEIAIKLFIDGKETKEFKFTIGESITEETYKNVEYVNNLEGFVYFFS